MSRSFLARQRKMKVCNDLQSPAANSDFRTSLSKVREPSSKNTQGPQDEDYRFLLQELRGEWQPRVSTSGDTHVAEIDFQIDRPGTYRLRAATVDLAGRTP